MNINKSRDWLNFILSTVAFVLCLMGEVYLGAIIFGAFSLRYFPYRRIYVPISKFLLILILACIGIWFISKTFKTLSSIGNYEGASAKEWYYEYEYSESKYEELRNCVESYSDYYGFEDYNDLTQQLDDISNCL